MVVLQVMLELFFIILIGYFLAKKNVMNQDTAKRISVLVVNITFPALIIASVSANLDQGSLSSVMGIFLLGIICYAVLPLFAWIFGKCIRVPEEQQGIYQFMFIFGNCAFMGYPVLAAIFGSQAIFLGAIFNLPFNLLAFSYGIMLVCRDGEKKAGFQPSKLLNPGIVASLLALLIYGVQLRLPLILVDLCDMLGNMTTPLSMLVLGVSLAELPIKDVFLDVRIYLMSFIRLLLIPFLTYFLLQLFVSDTMSIGVAVISFAMPVASMAVMLSSQYEGNVKLASIGVFVSTLLSVITIPIISALLF
ncbi:MAG: AEC family transporter [Lachnospiraceae bacterium]|nr:AEC family transporter [Lachnospiraceae bacterium]